VVDPEELRLVDQREELGVELPGRREVVPEGLLDDDPRTLREPRLGQPLDHRGKEERRDLEIEDRELRALDRLGDAPVRRRVGEVARDVRETRRETLEDGVVDLLARRGDALACVLDELLGRPVVHGDADDGDVEEAALLQPVEGAEGHHAGEVAGDPEDDEHVTRLRAHARARVPPRSHGRQHFTFGDRRTTL
jgi:hypothetical protein